jgi:hypothetical protein
MSRAAMRLVYFVHDLGDPAVVRRLDMLRAHVDSAVVMGFHRAAVPPAQVAGWPAIALGRTADARLGQRVLSVLRAGAMLHRLRAHLAGATVVMARQLEMLPLARSARNRYAPGAVLAYECLDIHRLMVATSMAGAALRGIEAHLLRGTDLLVVSSPAFIRDHLAPRHGAALPPVCLVENKVLCSDLARAPAPIVRPPGPPWRIGWSGVLRCRRSLDLLAGLTRALPGQIVVDLSGKPALSAIPDFHARVAAEPGLRFLGPYDRRHDLPAIYRDAHFTWAIDFFEADANSRWLLPNRLYEGGLHGAVPIALASVETGRWLAARHAGVLLEEPLAPALLRALADLTPETYAAETARLHSLPIDTWLDDGRDGARLAAALRHRTSAQPGTQDRG